MTMKVSETMTTGQLIEAHNRLAPRPIRSWKRSKRELVLRIEDLRPSPGEKKRGDGRVQRRALQLLAEVGPDGRGLSYSEVAERLSRELGTRTRVGSVRWYASHARAGRFGAIALPEKRKRS